MKLLSLILILALVASGYSATTVTQVVTEGSTQCTAFVLKCEADTKETNADGAVYTWTYNDGTDKTLATTSYYAIDTSDGTKFSQTIIVKPGTFAVADIKPICSIQQQTGTTDVGTAAANASGTPTISVTENADCTNTPLVSNFQRLTGATGSEVCEIDLQIATGDDSLNKIFTIGGKSTADTVFNTGIQTLDATTTGTIYVIYAEDQNDDQLIQVITGAAPTTLCNLKPLVDETKTTDACQNVVFKYTETKGTNFASAQYILYVIDGSGNLLIEDQDFVLIQNLTGTDLEFYIAIFEEAAIAGDLTVYFQIYQFSDADSTILIGDGTSGVTSTLTMTKGTCASDSTMIYQDYAYDCQYKVYTYTDITAVGKWKYYGFNTHDVSQAKTLYTSPNNLEGIFLIQDGTTNQSAHLITQPETTNCVGYSVTYEDETVDADLGHLIFQRCTQDVTVTCQYTNLNNVADANIKIKWKGYNNNDDYDWESETGKTITIPAGTFYSNTDVAVGCSVSYDNGVNIYDYAVAYIEYMQGDKPCTACPAANPSGTTEADSANILCIVVIALLALIF